MSRSSARRLAVEALEDRSLPSGTLYFSRDGDPNGLYMIDPVTAAATQVGAGTTNVTGATVGLAQTSFKGLLFGSAPDGLTLIQAAGSRAVTTGNQTIEGLAVDRQTGALYGTAGAALFTINPATGAIVNTLASPPENIEGLSDIGPGHLVGLSDTGNLYDYDIDADAWTLIGATGLALDDAGLAFDPETGTLYAKSALDTMLYTLDPATAAPTVVGDTGLTGGGGLAFAVDETTSGVVTAVLSPAGTLTLIGDARDNGIGIALNEAGVGTTIVGLGGTKIRLGNVVQDSFVLGPQVKALTVRLNDGADKVVIHPTAGFALPGSATIDLGPGKNALHMQTAGDIAVGGHLTVTARDGEDDVIILTTGAGTVVGNVSVSLGDGLAKVSVGPLDIHGPGGFRYASGAGDDVVFLGAVTIDRGGVQLLTGNGRLVATLGAVKARGTIRATGAGDVIAFLGDTDSGGLEVVSSPFADAQVQEIGAANIVRGNMTVRGRRALVGANTLTVDGSLTAVGLMASLAVADLTVGRSLTAAGSQTAMVNGMNVAVGGRLAVRGSEVQLETPAGGTLTAGSVVVVGAVVGLLRLTDSTVTVAGDVRVSAGGQASAVVINQTGTLTVGGNWAVTGGSVLGAAFLGSTAGSQRVKGSVRLTGGNQLNAISSSPSLQVDGSVIIGTGDGLTQVVLGDDSGLVLSVGKDLLVTTRNGNDVIGLIGVWVGGRTAIRTGGGEDAVVIRNGTEFLGPTTIDLGAGDDVIEVATVLGDGAAVGFGGRTTIRTGAGNDRAQLGKAFGLGGDANTLVAFHVKGNVLDMGTGFDTFDIGTFAVASQMFGVLTVLGNGLPPVTLP